MPPVPQGAGGTFSMRRTNRASCPRPPSAIQKRRFGSPPGASPFFFAMPPVYQLCAVATSLWQSDIHAQPLTLRCVSTELCSSVRPDSQNPRCSLRFRWGLLYWPDRYSGRPGLSPFGCAFGASKVAVPLLSGIVPSSGRAEAEACFTPAVHGCSLCGSAHWADQDRRCRSFYLDFRILSPSPSNPLALPVPTHGPTPTPR